MQISAKGIADVRVHEGYRARHYLDPVGVGTIGYGFTWASAEFRRWWGQHRPGERFGAGAEITRAEADEILARLIANEYGPPILRFLERQPAQHVFDAMASVVYNLGPRALGWNWAKATKRHDLAGAARHLRETGITARGRALRGLVIRRKAEARLLEHGIYAHEAAAVDGKFPDRAMADGLLTRGERGPKPSRIRRSASAASITPSRIA